MLVAPGYNERNKTFGVEFTNGGIYQSFDVETRTSQKSLKPIPPEVALIIISKTISARPVCDEDNTIKKLDSEGLSH